MAKKSPEEASVNFVSDAIFAQPSKNSNGGDDPSGVCDEARDEFYWSKWEKPQAPRPISKRNSRISRDTQLKSRYGGVRLYS